MFRILKIKILELLKIKFLFFAFILTSHQCQSQDVSFNFSHTQAIYSADSIYKNHIEAVERAFALWDRQFNVCPKDKKCITCIDVWYNLPKNQSNMVSHAILYASEYLIHFKKIYPNRNIYIRDIKPVDDSFLKIGFFSISIKVLIDIGL